MFTEEKQVDVSHYDFSRYVSKERWNSFYHQITGILAFKPSSVLEVGVGLGITGAVLKQAGVHYESLDIDSGLRPDYVGSVLQMPFPDKSYDVAGCFEVLEHLPYECFEPALKELFRVARKGVVISLPVSRRVWKYSIYLPKIGSKDILLPRPFFKKKKAAFDGQHYWEINRIGFELKTIRAAFAKTAAASSFTLERDYDIWESPDHHFFVLKASSLWNDAGRQV